MKYSKFTAWGLGATLATAFTFTAPAQAAVDIIEIDGSSTVYPITEAIAEEFQKETGIKVPVEVLRNSVVVTRSSLTPLDLLRRKKSKNVKRLVFHSLNFLWHSMH